MTTIDRVGIERSDDGKRVYPVSRDGQEIGRLIVKSHLAWYGEWVRDLVAEDGDDWFKPVRIWDDELGEALHVAERQLKRSEAIDEIEKIMKIHGIRITMGGLK